MGAQMPPRLDSSFCTSSIRFHQTFFPFFQPWQSKRGGNFKKLNDFPFFFRFSSWNLWVRLWNRPNCKTNCPSPMTTRFPSRAYFEYSAVCILYLACSLCRDFSRFSIIKGFARANRDSIPCSFFLILQRYCYISTNNRIHIQHYLQRLALLMCA